MAGQSKRTTAPVPTEFPWPPAQSVPPPAQSAPPPAIPSMFVPGAWVPPRPPQSMAPSSPPCWLAGVHQPVTGSSSAQGPWWIPPAGIGVSGQRTHMAENLEDHDLQAWGLDSHPPGDDTNGDDCARTEMMSESSYTDDSDELAPSKIMEVYVAEQNALDSFVERLTMKIKARLGEGLSHRRWGPRKTIRRDHEGAHQRLVEDYFAERPLYPESMFRTRFRMNRDLFQRIVSALGQRSTSCLPSTKKGQGKMSSVLLVYCSPVLALFAGLHVYGRERVLEGSC